MESPIIKNRNTCNGEIDFNSQSIREDQTLLLIVDHQEKLIQKIEGNKLITFNIKRLIDSCILLNVEIVISEQNPSRLGETSKEILPLKDLMKFEKMEFSCLENRIFKDYLSKKCVKNIILCGIESHICILQTSLDLLSNKFNVLIPRDAIGSRNNIDNETAFIRLTSSGAIPSTTESLICELCKNASRKEFKDISRILKKTI